MGWTHQGCATHILAATTTTTTMTTTTTGNHHHRLLMCAISTLNLLQHTAATPLKATTATPIGYLHGITIRCAHTAAAFSYPHFSPRPLPPRQHTAAAPTAIAFNVHPAAKPTGACSYRSTQQRRLLCLHPPQHATAQPPSPAPSAACSSAASFACTRRSMQQRSLLH
jgi:hypothetical protein